MINILEEQIKSGVYCTDIRPYNYVIRHSDLVVKMIDFKKLPDYYSKTGTDYEISESLEPFYEKFRQYGFSVKTLKNFVISRYAWLIRSPKNYYEIVEFYDIKNPYSVEKSNDDMNPGNLFEHLFIKYKNKNKNKNKKRYRKRKSS